VEGTLLLELFVTLTVNVGHCYINLIGGGI
jgi:hypothetical protein